MIENGVGQVSVVAPGFPTALLHAAREAQRTARLAEVRVLELAVEWAALHPADTLATGAASFWDPAAGWAEPIVGTGCPSISEYATADLGAVLGMSTVQAKRLIGHALELHHRLPKVWAEVRGGEVDVWRARAVAEATIHHFSEERSEAAARWLDARVAPMLGRVGRAAITRLVEEAELRFGLLAPGPDLEDPCHDTSYVWIDTDAMSFTGTMQVRAELQLADALDLEHVLQQGAAELSALGCADTLDQRRARALGDLAREQTALRLGDDQQGRAFGTRGGLPVARRLDISVLVSATCQDERTAPDLVARLGSARRPVRWDWVTRWARDSFTEVVVRPVLDLDAEIASVGYRPGPRLRRQVATRDQNLRLPVVRALRRGLRRRPHHALRLRSTGGDPDPHQQLGGPVSTTPPTQDPHQLAVSVRRTGDL